ncbi:MAG: PAS domain S-box protein [Rhodothermales bacterium]
MSNVFPVPSNEHERLLALDRYAILDTEPEAEYNRIVELVRTVFDVPIALISIVGAETQQFKARCGLGVRGTGRDIAFCAHAILEAEPTIIEDASADPRFMDNPLVTGEPFIRFYAGMPLISPEGYALGTLCVCDSRPRTLTPAQVETLREFAELVNHELARRRDRVQHGDKVHALYEDPRVILDGMSDAFFVLDRDFRFRHVNAQAEKLLKLDRGALEGKSIWSTFPELIQSVLHDKLVKAHAEHLDLEFEQFFETWHVWLRVRILSVENELSVFLSEITNQVKKSQALRDSEALKSAILDAAFDCIITIDEEARIIEFNTAAERTFGFSRHEVLGRVLTDLIIPHHFRDAHTRGMEHYMRTGEGPVLGRRIEISALRHDNTEFPVELAISPILLENNRRLFTAYLRDITQRKEAEQALREALDKERKLGEMKSRFVAQASHEFRTPLSMIRSSAQLIKRVYQNEPEKTIKYLRPDREWGHQHDPAP